MKIPLPAKVRAFGKTISSVKRRTSSIDEENKLLEEENERLKIQREQLAKQLKAAEDEMGPLIPIDFIDEDGEVLQLQTTKNEGSNHLFDRYARKQGTPFLLGRIIYEFRFNGQLIPNVTIGSLGIVAGDAGQNFNNAIIYVTTKLPNMKDFNERIVPNIPIIVQDYPRCFINQHVAIRTKDDSPLGGVVTDYLDEDTGVFTIEWTDGTIGKYDLDEFAIFLQKSYRIITRT